MRQDCEGVLGEETSAILRARLQSEQMRGKEQMTLAASRGSRKETSSNRIKNETAIWQHGYAEQNLHQIVSFFGFMLFLDVFRFQTCI